MYVHTLVVLGGLQPWVVASGPWGYRSVCMQVDSANMHTGFVVSTYVQVHVHVAIIFNTYTLACV